MKKKILNIVKIAFVLTTVAFLLDGDAKEPSMLMRFMEFFGMTAIFTLIVSAVYFPTSFLRNKLSVFAN